MSQVINARQELVDFLEEPHSKGSRIKCAVFERVLDLKTRKSIQVVLKFPHTAREYVEFFDTLDFDYDRAYLILSGNIWFMDGSWANRREYDGLDAWEYQKCPDIPDFCLLLYPNSRFSIVKSL